MTVVSDNNRNRNHLEYPFFCYLLIQKVEICTAIIDITICSVVYFEAHHLVVSCSMFECVKMVVKCLALSPHISRGADLDFASGPVCAELICFNVVSFLQALWFPLTVQRHVA